MSHCRLLRYWMIVVQVLFLVACTGGTRSSWQDQPGGDAEALFNEGIANYQRGNFEQAIQAFSAAILLQPDKPDLYVNRGSAYTNVGRIDEAIADYQKAIAIDPAYAEAYVGRGAAYYLQNNLDLALADYQKAIELNPNLVGAFFNRGMIFRQRGELERAKADFQKVLEIGTDLYWKQQAEIALAELEAGLRLESTPKE